MPFITFVLFLLISLAGCSPEARLEMQLDKVMSEEVKYIGYSDNGFSIEYPYWPATADRDSSVEISVTKGYCTVIINTEQARPDQLYKVLVAAVDGSNRTILILDDDEHRVKYSALYEELTMLSDNRVYGCNGLSHIVSVVCIAEADDDAQHIHETVFGSAECKEEEGLKTEYVPLPEAVDEKISYILFDEDDFVIEYPDWDAFPEEGGQRVLGVTKGICSVIVDRHNARPGDIINWLEVSTDNDEESEILKSYRKGDVYYFDYSRPYEEYHVTAKSKH